jgi:hypothetical protein
VVARASADDAASGSTDAAASAAEVAVSETPVQAMIVDVIPRSAVFVAHATVFTAVESEPNGATFLTGGCLFSTFGVSRFSMGKGSVSSIASGAVVPCLAARFSSKQEPQASQLHCLQL